MLKSNSIKIVKQLIWRNFLVAAMLSVLSACITNPVTGDNEFLVPGQQSEINLGKQAHSSIMRQYAVYDNPALQSKINEIGQRLARKSHRPDLQYTFTLLDSPEVNAFAIGGGFIYITRGIIAYMNSEEELAGVLGHELGHVTALHSLQGMRNQQIQGGLKALLGAHTNNQLVHKLYDVGSTALVRGYGRSKELEADRLGAQYLARTGYQPEKMIDVVGILKDQEQYEIVRAREEGRQPRIYHGLFSTHPRNDLRLQTVIKAAREFQNPEAQPVNPERFKKLLQGMTFGDSEEQGIVRDSKFYHKPLNLGITYPNSWKIQNLPKELVAISPKKDKVIILKMAGKAENRTAEQFLRQAVKGIKQIKAINNKMAIGRVQQRTRQGIVTITLVAKNHLGNMYVLQAQGNQSVERDVLNVANSMRQLNAREKELATARKITLVRAKPGDTFESLARRSSLKNDVVAQLRLINGKYPDGQPKPGELIKIVE